MLAMTQKGNLADQSPSRGGNLSDLLREIDREAEARRSQSEILEFIQEALEKPEEPASVPLSADEASRLDLAKAGVNEVVRNADSILVSIADPVLRTELLLTINDALFHAYVLGNYSTLSKSMWERYKSQHHHQHTKPAINARKKAWGVQELIERLAHDLWSRKPSYKGNPNHTAKEIQPSFNREIAQLEKIPKAWQPADLANKASVKREIERIRKRVAKMEGRTIDVRPANF